MSAARAPTRRALGQSSGWYAGGVTAAVAVIALLVSGVTPWELLRFAGYQVVLVLAPGVLLYLVVLGRRASSRLEQCTIGYALGVAVELLSFGVSAALGARSLSFVGPALVLLVCGAVLASRGRDALHTSPAGAVQSSIAWGACAVVSLSIASFSLGFFVSNPLPRDVASVAYSQDLVFHLAVAGEARERWPVEDPNVSGEPLRYHTFSNQQLAAVNQVTGIPLDVLVFRLWPMAILLAVAGATALLAHGLGAKGGTALVAVGLLLLAGELDLDTKQVRPFIGGSLLSRVESPSFLLGALLFLVAMVLLLRIVDLGPEPGADRRSRIPDLALLLVTLSAASGAKASVLPVILGGLALFGLRELARNRRLPSGLLPAAVVALMVFVVSYVLLYRGGGSGLELGPLHYGRVVGDPLPPALASLVGQLGLVGALAPLVGVPMLLVIRRGRLGGGGSLAVCMFLASLIAFSLLSQQGLSEQYFLLYGYLALLPVSAIGLREAWGLVPAEPASRRRWLVWAAALGVAAFAILNGGELVATRIVDSRVERAGLFTILATCGLLCLVAGLIVIQRHRGTPWVPLAAMASIAIAAFCLLDYPIDVSSRLVSRWSDGQKAWDESVSGSNNGMTAELREGMLWLRKNSDPDAVIAVNNFFTYPAVARYFYYSAFSQRRTYLGGWEYSQRGMDVLKAKPLPLDLQERARLSLLAASGAPDALQALRRAGVSYLVVDRLNGQFANTEALDALIRPDFTNSAVSIYDLRR